MMRACVACGKPFEAKRSTAKYCGSSCRAKVSTGAVVLLNAEPKSAPVVASGLVETTRGTLAEAGRESSPLGMAALELAMTIASSETPPSAKAQLTREFRATLSEALAGAAKASSPQQLRDEVAARRAAHGA